MRNGTSLLFGFLWLAAASAQTRPHYGGTLILETAAANNAGPTDWQYHITRLTSESIQRLSSNITRDGDRWIFTLRTGLTRHDGSDLTAASAARDLAVQTGWKVSFSGGALTVRGAPQRDWRSDPAARIPATGPFTLAESSPRLVRLASFDGHWEGRPYLDAIEIRFERPLDAQLRDLELGQADVVEVTPLEARRREAQQRPAWTGALLDLIALRARPAVPRAHIALAAAALDRDPVASVILQKTAEPTAALLPAWLTGYAFLFPATRRLTEARGLAAGVDLDIGHEPGDPNLRAIAERLALNLRDAGAQARVQGGPAALTVVRAGGAGTRPVALMRMYCAALGADCDASAQTWEQWESAERRALNSPILPLFHAARTLGLGRRVRNWMPRGAAEWRLEEVWLQP